MTAYPRWIMGALRCDAGAFIPAIRAAGAPMLKGLAREGFARPFYELDASAGELVFYGARWNGLEEAQAARRFQEVLERAGAASGLAPTEAKPYRGLATEVLGGAPALEPIEDFARWGSAACLAFIRRNDAATFRAGRHVFAMLLSDAAMNALGLARAEKVRFLEEWHDALLERGGRMLQEVAREIAWEDLDRVYLERKPFWRRLFAGESIGMDSVRDELNPTVYPILAAFARAIAAPAARARALRGDPGLTRPFGHVVLKKLVHLNWVRLDLYNQYELMFLYLLRRILADEA